MRRLERSIEQAFLNWVVNQHPNYKALKMNLDGTTGFPDRMVIGPDRTMFFIEFKRPGEKPRPLQVFYHNYLTECGHVIEVCESLEEAKEAFFANIQAS